ncbi:MAG: cytochrome c [Segetibacter sp.]|nr:cytochrome c [Segetibacter sp.]
MSKKSSIAVILISVCFAGCYYDKEDLVYPRQTTTTTTTTSCDTTAVKYSVDIKNILSTNCYACHSGTATNGGGFKFDVYPGNLVAKALSGALVGSITHSPGFSPMPKGGGKLSDCDIAKIRTWVRNGAPNN